jgi:hypothetical protein
MKLIKKFIAAIVVLYGALNSIDIVQSIAFHYSLRFSSLAQISTNWSNANSFSKNDSTLFTDVNRTHLNTRSYSNGTESRSLPRIEPFIEFSLLDGVRLNVTEASQYACRNVTTGEPLATRKDLPTKHPFNFAITIRTNLNILVMGDSLAVEFGSWFQVASEATNKTILQMLSWRKSIAEGMAIAHVQGGGSIAYWRILGFLKEENRKFLLPNYGKGWRASWIRQLWSNLQNHTSRRIDVFIFRISHPWLKIDEVTTTELKNQVEFAQWLLGEKIIIIFLTAPMNNNLITDQDFIRFSAMNDLVRSFALTVNKPNILLSDIESYMNNARQIGMNISDPSYLSSSLTPEPGENFANHIAQVCSENVPHLSKYCQKNMISNDGMHFCMETLGPRMFANWACLIQCSLKSAPRTCNDSCHERFFVF